MQDVVWMLATRDGQFWYSPPGKSAKECWDKAEDWEQFEQGGACIIGWKEDMKRRGFAARRIVLTYHA